jgi:signal transduction histidine kinase/CheY-like chemotaxis protein
LYLYRICTLLGLMLFGVNSMALLHPLENNISRQAMIELKNVQYVLEGQTQYSYQRILGLEESRWHSPKNFPLNLGVLPSGAWVRFDMTNVEPESIQRVLEISNTGLHHLAIYLQAPNESLQEWQLGNSLPFLERPIITRNFAVPVSLNAKQTVRVYVRAESSIGVLVPLRLHLKENFWQLAITENMGYGFYFGILFMFVVFNVGLYLFRNDILHLILAVDLAAFGFMYGNHLGLNFEYLWPVDPHFNNLASLFFSYLTILTANVFTWRFVQLKVADHPMIKLFYYGFNMSALCGFIILWFIPTSVSSYFCALLSFLVVFYLLYLTCLSYREGALYAACYMTGYGLAALSAVVYILHKLAFLPTNIVIENAFGASILLQALILTSVMLERRKVNKKILGFQEQERFIPHSVRDSVAQFSHEIRTPLNGIIGMADLLKETPLNPTQYNYVRSLSSSGEHLIELVSGILDYESLASGQVQLLEADFNLVDLCQQSCDSFSRMATENKVTVEVQYEKGMPLDLCADSKRFRQILLNLLNNSIKFAQGGKVVISLSFSAGHELNMQVWDSGIGMSKLQQQEVFKRFRQADGSVYQRFGGNGLGLAICEQLANLMSGNISVDSKLNEFCCFTVVLPMSVATPNAYSSVMNSPVIDSPATPVERLTTLPENLTILGVDDNEINRRVLKAMLNKLGHNAVEATSGQAAIDIVRSGVDIDLILMDCEMPAMNGFDATRAIRRWQYGQADKVCRIVALTAHTLDEHKDRCLESGMDGHLSKPLHLQELRELIDQLATSPSLKQSARTPSWHQ